MRYTLRTCFVSSSFIYPPSLALQRGLEMRLRWRLGMGWTGLRRTEEQGDVVITMQTFLLLIYYLFVFFLLCLFMVSIIFNFLPRCVPLLLGAQLGKSLGSSDR